MAEHLINKTIIEAMKYSEINTHELPITEKMQQFLLLRLESTSKNIC